jgi:hypothetical protein
VHVLLTVPSPVQVETEVLAHYEQQLLEKENSGCAALLRDDKVQLFYRNLHRAPWAATLM